MSNLLHRPADDSQHVYKWYKNAQINYTELYIRMYISYNAWYRLVTHTTNDREALSVLKKRFVIWDDYCQGKTMNALKVYVEKLVQLTNDNPLDVTNIWNGKVKNSEDWRGLIEYWYQLRCLVVHGSEVSTQHVWLAYETLDIFMAEIVMRMQACFTFEDLQRLEELSTLVRVGDDRDQRFKNLQQKLQAKYIHSPDIWQVDMQRVT